MEKLDALAGTIASNPVIRAIRKGMLYLLPLTLTGSLMLMLLNLPIPLFQNAMTAVFGEHWKTVGLWIYHGTFNIMSVTALIAVSCCFAGEFKLVRNGEVNQLTVMLVALASYIIYYGGAEEIIKSTAAGSYGLFGALSVALLSTALFLGFFRLSFSRMRLMSNDIDAVLLYSMRSFVPALCTVGVFALARTVSDITGMESLTSLLHGFFERLSRSGDGGMRTSILFIICSHVLWILGIHGNNVLDGVSENIFAVASQANAWLVAAGGRPTAIFTREFFNVFVFMGGSGSTIGLLLVRWWLGRKNRTNRLERYALLPAIFNINEVMVYGLPIIFNPYFALPFLLAPVVMCILAYLSMRLGLVPLTSTPVEWTTPLFMSGYICTGSVRGIVLQAVNLTASIGIYLPFAHLYQKHQDKNNSRIFQTLAQSVQYVQENKPKTILGRTDDVGIHARLLAADIETCIDGRLDLLRLEYQPKVNGAGQVVGAEALLRCTHPVYGSISPPVVLAVADEADLGNKLGRWVIETAFAEQHRWRQAGHTNISLSINLSPTQIHTDSGLVKMVESSLARYGLDATLIELELTENIAIDLTPQTQKKLAQLKDLGVSLSIDDFGMGHSSLLYLRDFYANVVKIDRSLISNVVANQQSRQIVHSICRLCIEMGVAVVAEGTETAEEVEALQIFGCKVFQGFYFSPALPGDSFLSYVKENGSHK